MLGTDVYTAVLAECGVDDRISDVLGEVTTDGVDAAAAEIAGLIGEVAFSAPVRSAIEDAYAAAGADRVAVRSSGREEDGETHSFAGQFASFLNVSGVDEVCARVRDCWASVFSARSLHYRLRHGLPLETAGMAVLVQELVTADRSGVLFTANPVTGDREQCVISSVYGLGEGLVSGAVDADTVVLDSRGDVVDRIVGEKRDRIEAVAAGDGCRSVEVPEHERAAFSLRDKDIVALHELGSLITALSGAPQDIEWAIAGETVWILQARPVTTPVPPSPVAAEPVGDGDFRVWDNANIIESFSGITSPLTFSFAADAYARIYRHYARSLRVPGRWLSDMDEWLPHLLGQFHGRVYYNLLHWYRMVRLAPLYPVNRKVLEASLGVEEPLDDALAKTLRPHRAPSGIADRVARLVTVAEFVRRFFRTSALVDEFAREFYLAYRVFDRVDYDALPGAETYRRFQALERELIAKWGSMMVLDATLLISFGALHVLTKRWLPDAPEWFTPAVAGPGPEVESAEPVHALTELASKLHADEGLRSLVFRTEPGAVRNALAAQGYDEFLADVDDYIDRFGYRSVDELKLEVPDLREDPSSLFVLLRGAVPGKAERTAVDAESYLDENLRGVRRAVYEVVRRKVRGGLRDRERLRFCRTRAFGSAKRMLRAMGRDLAASGVLADWSDVFFLRLAEVRALFTAEGDRPDAARLVAQRKRQRAGDEGVHAPSRFRTTGSGYSMAELVEAGWRHGEAERTGALVFHGVPSCPGTAEGRAVVTEAPEDVDGGILVAYRTDPGWVSALRSASALVIERGSPLTHVAIVARELGLPTVVQVPGVVRELRTGMRVRVDGAAGVLTVLDAGEVLA
ncbi:phosphoenolpyruvate synthase [Amycolatopsis minnesotensis]|uniref:Phosphoenolpyruvate synthase n=1 Tax=Amycolatopsis minnesotensis TaxID=337894 RepID=A0ABN2QSX7_9PSEU